MASLISAVHQVKANFWSLIKSRQTFLLTLTGVAGYLCRSSHQLNWLNFTGLLVSLFFTISGCTVLNMLLDRDIDRKMVRTRQRPLASGQVDPGSALILGSVLISSGLLVAASLSGLYFVIILAGLVLNVLVYTLWLKRRSAWSILGGGLAGGMPILAGSVLAIGRIDAIGVLLALVIVCWIPSHNLTLSRLYSADYLEAGIPTFLSNYGGTAVNLMVTISSVLVAMLVTLVSSMLGFSRLELAFMFVVSFGLLSLGVISWINPSPKLTAFSYKYSSLYMLVSMLVLSFNGLVLY
jgi:protoheme IX farnesyltransferase